MTEEEKFKMMSSVLAGANITQLNMGDGFMQIVSNSNKSYSPRAEHEDEGEDPLVKELLPVFKNNEEVVMEFLKSIDGAKPTAVTELVNRYIRDGKLLKANAKGVLWSILNKYNLYRPTEQNWNMQVN